MFDEPLVHITDDGRRHLLKDHLLKTAEMAADFAAVFGFRQWGRLAGLWHDLGKYSAAFQKKLRTAGGGDARCHSWEPVTVKYVVIHQ